MSNNDYLSEIYDQRPQLIVHEALRHSKSAQDVMELAQQRNYEVSFARGPFWGKDVIIKEQDRKPASHSIQSAIRYISTGT